jgi:hypothetical protein
LPGKIEIAIRKKESIPKGWIIDKNGGATRRRALERRRDHSYRQGADHQSSLLLSRHGVILRLQGQPKPVSNVAPTLRTSASGGTADDTRTCHWLNKVANDPNQTYERRYPRQAVSTRIMVR